MKNIFLGFVFILLNFHSFFGQESILVGEKYLEDQIYVGITYNILNNKSRGLEQRGLSMGYQLGFIKDIPLNQKGSFAFGIGLGYGYNQFKQNLKITEGTEQFSIVEMSKYGKNKFETHVIELPFEIRFRITSTPTVYKFWRIYIGGKISYVFASKSIYNDTIDGVAEHINVNPIPYHSKWQYGPQISFGYSTFNFYTFYNINSLFENTPVSENLDVNKLRTFKVGLQFYIF
jgi:hypothetical protein